MRLEDFDSEMDDDFDGNTYSSRPSRNNKDMAPQRNHAHRYRGKKRESRSSDFRNNHKYNLKFLYDEDRNI